jgi:hypothetical protein
MGKQRVCYFYDGGSPVSIAIPAIPAITSMREGQLFGCLRTVLCPFVLSHGITLQAFKSVIANAHACIWLAQCCTNACAPLCSRQRQAHQSNEAMRTFTSIARKELECRRDRRHVLWEAAPDEAATHHADSSPDPGLPPPRVHGRLRVLSPPVLRIIAVLYACSGSHTFSSRACGVFHVLLKPRLAVLPTFYGTQSVKGYKGAGLRCALCALVRVTGAACILGCCIPPRSGCERERVQRVFLPVAEL